MRRIAIAASVALASWSASAWAQSEGRIPAGGTIGRELSRLEIDDCPTRPDLDDQALRGVASEHYERGDVLYVQGDYKGAVRELVASYCLLPHYSVLKGIGQAYERDLQYERAVAYLERYVLAIPADARRRSPCDAEPAEEKRNVSARIQVLRNLPASLRVTTSPPGALVTLVSAAGVRAQDRANGRTLEVVSGHYTMTVELPGREPVSLEIDPEIGKPYSYYFELAARRGRLNVSVDRGDARLFLDDRLIGLGGFNDLLPGGSYKLVVEAPNRLPERRRVAVTADRETRIAVHLQEPPASGRTQLVVASSLAGAIGGGVAADAVNSDLSPLGAGLGLVVGGAGAWLGIPRSIPVGTSSLIITGGLIGALEATRGAELFRADDTTRVGLGAIGVVGGVAVGAIAAHRLQLDAGDAALLNSGALWGTTVGYLFTSVFEHTNDTDDDSYVDTALVLSGLNLGIVSGALLASRFEWSRGHVALIDLGGLSGAIVGVATQAALDKTFEQGVHERRAHFALAGITLGLITGGILTRDLDTPRLRVQPTATRTRGADGSAITTFGVTGNF